MKVEESACSCFSIAAKRASPAINSGVLILTPETNACFLNDKGGFSFNRGFVLFLTFKKRNISPCLKPSKQEQFSWSESQLTLTLR